MENSTNEGKKKALESAMLSIEKQFGKGSIMRLGDASHMDVETWPTGSTSPAII